MDYRHQCHVGDHGDALKHPVLALLIQLLSKKHTKLNIIDTHAGTGCYDLNTAPPSHAAEFSEGVGYLWKNKDQLPTSFHSFITTLSAFNPSDELRLYPGSAAIGFQQGRSEDSFYFADIQKQEAELLQTNIEQIRSDLHIKSDLNIFTGDGLKNLVSALSNHHEHNLIVIDPPYEKDDEYSVVIEALIAAWEHTKNVSALIWYPLYTEDKSTLILQRCSDAVNNNQLPKPIKAELRLRDAKEDDRLIGSGLLLFNPPAALEASVIEVVDYLHQNLATENEGYWQVK